MNQGGSWVCARPVLDGEWTSPGCGIYWDHSRVLGAIASVGVEAARGVGSRPAGES